jgi:trimeric autotransporter adhesin
MRRFSICLLLSCVAFCSQASGQSGIITTVAGNGNPGFSGDGGPATAASLSEPSGVAVDASGNLFIADLRNNRVRKVSASGEITTVAGNGDAGFSGDGGPATAASLNQPTDVAVDASGNLFIADDYNQRIRKVSVDGIITTFAGNGASGFSGDGGPAASAAFYYPSAVAVDASGNLFISDTANCRIRKVSADGIISTVAGNGNYGFSGDGGPATSASLFSPGALAVDASGRLFISDVVNNRIREVSTSGIITTVAGNGPTCEVAEPCGGFSGDGGPATSASLNRPSGVALDSSGNLFIADYYNNLVRKVSASGIIITFAGTGRLGFSGDGGPATLATLRYPFEVAADAFGNLFIVDTDNERIRCVGGSIDPFRRNRFCQQYTDDIPDRRLDLPR